MVESNGELCMKAMRINIGINQVWGDGESPIGLGCGCERSAKAEIG